MKDLLRIADLTQADLEQLLTLAADIRREPGRTSDLLRGELVALSFAKPSTRTRFSFEAAVHRLGGATVSVGPQDLQLGRGETIEDTAKTLSRFVRAIVIRTHAHAEIVQFARFASVPVINALTDSHHPCQALADLLTLRERLGELRSRRLAYVGDGNNVCCSLMEAAALAGLEIAVATPPGFEPDAAVAEEANAIAAENGTRLILTNDPHEALAGATAVYTDTWMSMHIPEAAREERLRAFAGFQVSERLLEHAAPGAIFLHCLPAHRGEEVAAEVLDGPRSVVFEQVENRAHTEQAVLTVLLERRLLGRRGSKTA